MLLSLSKKFLFIANLKTASTSIEKVLAPYAELRLMQSNFGKHQSFADFAERFKWMLGLVDVNELFIFGVMRDPVDYVLSIYNSHKSDTFKNNARLYTGNMDFGQFIQTWVPKNADQIRPQVTRFTHGDGRIAANLLISFDKLQQGLELVAKKLNTPELLTMPKLNESPKGVTRDELLPEQIAWIESRMQRDIETIKRYCNKIGGFASIAAG
jgi:hypothetical protein